jgi:phosphoserine phosphatase RsbU/P
MSPGTFNEKEKLNEENLRLRSAVEELSILNDIATAIASTQSLDQITNLIVKKSIKHLKAEQGSIQLVDEKDFNNPFHTMIRVKDSRYGSDPLRFNKQLSDLMLVNKKPLLINEFKQEETFSLKEDSVLKIRSLLSVPMIIKGKMTGILSLFNKEGGFTEADQRLLSIIAAQSANVIENSRLFEEEKKLLQIQQELRVASEIQKRILPQEIPAIKGYDIYAINIPAQEVGGDYYDFINISDTRTAVALGDVSGKGLPAAMVMANLQATLRGQVLFSSSANDCIKRSNNLLFRSTDVSKFVTLFFGIIDTEKNTLTFCNAGHNEPYYLYGNNHTRLVNGGLILGCLEDSEYSEDELPLEKGSVLVIFSDGITEAFNTADEEYGDERLLTVIKNNSALTAKDLTTKILEDVMSFAAGTSQADDITLMVIKRSD